MRKYKLLVATLLLVFMTISLVACGGSAEIKNLDTGNDNELGVLVLSDLCYDGSSQDIIRDKMIKDIILEKDDEGVERPKFEFIVVNGNFVNGANNGELMRRACDVIDSYGVPWAATLGVNDVTGNTSKAEIIKIIKSYKNSYFMKGASYGDANYALDVFENDNYIQTLFFFDTSSDIVEDQAVWYSNLVNDRCDKYGDAIGKTSSIVTSVFMNNPVKEIAPIVNEWKKEDESIKSYSDIVTVASGSNLLNEIKRLDSTAAIFFGNNPNSAFTKEFNQIDYTFCRNMKYSTDSKQKNLYGAYSYIVKDSKYLSITTISKNLSSFE